MLLVKNLEGWKEVLPEEDLNRTTRDAIKVTRSLGIKYIWIDALCVIQDSEKDWLAQSAEMDKVYKYSYCNIAATGSANNDQGCFFTRVPKTNLPSRFDLDSEQTKDNNYSAKSKTNQNTLDILLPAFYGDPMIYT